MILRLVWFSAWEQLHFICGFSTGSAHGIKTYTDTLSVTRPNYINARGNAHVPRHPSHLRAWRRKTWYQVSASQEADGPSSPFAAMIYPTARATTSESPAGKPHPRHSGPRPLLVLTGTPSCDVSFTAGTSSSGPEHGPGGHRDPTADCSILHAP